MTTPVKIAAPPPAADDDTVLKLPPPLLGAERFPACLVWTPIPCITFLLPFVGHVGICNSEGVCHDFAGPYFISEDELAFGVPCRTISVLPWLFPAPQYAVKSLCDGSAEIRMLAPNAQRPAERLALYDRTIAKTANQFRRDRALGAYSFCCNNCHTFAATVLEDTGVAGQGWNMVGIAARFFFLGKFVTFWRAVWSLLPFCIIIGIIVLMSKFIK